MRSQLADPGLRLERSPRGKPAKMYSAEIRSARSRTVRFHQVVSLREWGANEETERGNGYASGFGWSDPRLHSPAVASHAVKVA